jgi:mannose-6-phosphate isomerase-like protein (cupin superfamily)
VTNSDVDLHVLHIGTYAATGRENDETSSRGGAMAAPDQVVNLEAKFAAFDEQWSPKIVGEINDMELKIAKVQGEFVWHTHEDTDEFFFVRSGRLTILLRGRDDVTLGPGEFFVVPKSVEHCPRAEEECEILLLEPKGVVNTGDVQDSDMTAPEEWI